MATELPEDKIFICIHHLERKTLYELTEESKLMIFRPTYGINKVTATWKKNGS